MSFLDIVDERFRALTIGDAALELLYGGGQWLEGPLWLDESEALLFSDIPADRVLRWTAGEGVSMLLAPADFQNGRARDREGRVVACEHGGRRLVRYELDGRVGTLCDHHGGRRLNSPNDVVVKRDGSIWFTDPDYGILSDYEGHRAPREQDACHLFRLDPGEREPIAVASHMVRPNGLAFDLREAVLYVADSGGSHTADGSPHHIRRFAVQPDRSLVDLGVFAEVAPGFPDGMAVDELGNVWTSAGDGVHCFDPSGTLLGRVLVPETVSNLCFGGARGDRLFITATRSLYALPLAIRGDSSL